MQITGTVKSITYRSDENGFTVLTIVDGTGEEITVVGTMPLASVGERIELEGEWKEHSRYGMQFGAQSCQTLSPATLGALIAYLGSGLIAGVGESTAENIVATFGMDTLEVLENSPERLTEVYGIGHARASVIASSFMEQKGMRDIMLALQKYGVTIGQAMKLYKIYGPLCHAKIEENPYRLIEDVENIGFKTADAMALNAGVEEDSPLRIRAGIKYTLQWARSEGHTCLPRQRLIEVAANKVLNAGEGTIERELDSLIISQDIAYAVANGSDVCFLPYLYSSEKACAQWLQLLCRGKRPRPGYDLDAQITRLEQELKISLAPQQHEAIKLAMNSGAMVITGGPGTGKTTILRFVIKLIELAGEEFELCAPTGRAAKRMTEATGCEARTIHRLLEYGFGEDVFTRNAENPIDADVVIVDEMSMVDVMLFWSLLRALRPGTRLIMVGDADQLPSVGAGNVLRDIIASDTIPTLRLTEIFRQGERSAIVLNAHRINNGQQPQFDEGDEFAFEEMNFAEEITRRLIALCSGAAKSLGAREPLKDIQVLTPTRKGPLGVKALNQRLQEALNPPAHKKKERKYGDTIFREGDKVMQIKNDYRMGWKRMRRGIEVENGEGVYNGDLGTIMVVDLYDQTVEVLFDDERSAIYEFSRLEELELAYCISIHKSQGSEFPIVVLPLAGVPPVLMTRNLIYTAVTRARSVVRMVGHKECLMKMVANDKMRERYSALASFLRSMSELLPL